MNKSNLPLVLISSRGLIFYENKFLFLRRANGDRHNFDKWELPGGKLDKGERLNINLLRECREETNLELLLVKSDLAVTDEKITKGKYDGFISVTILGLLKSLSSSPKLSPEHSEFLWLDLKDALKLDLTAVTKIFLDEIESTPYLMELLSNVNTLSLPKR